MLITTKFRNLTTSALMCSAVILVVYAAFRNAPNIPQSSEDVMTTLLQPIPPSAAHINHGTVSKQRRRSKRSHFSTPAMVYEKPVTWSDVVRQNNPSQKAIVWHRAHPAEFSPAPNEASEREKMTYLVNNKQKIDFTPIAHMYDDMQSALQNGDAAGGLQMCPEDYSVTIPVLNRKIRPIQVTRNSVLSAVDRFLRGKKVLSVDVSEDAPANVTENGCNIDRWLSVRCVVPYHGSDHDVIMRHHFRDTWVRAGNDWQIKHSILFSDSQEWWDGQEMPFKQAVKKLLSKMAKKLGVGV